MNNFTFLFNFSNFNFLFNFIDCQEGKTIGNFKDIQ